MINFEAGNMKNINGQICTDEFLIQMHTNKGLSNTFCKALLNTYFNGKLTIAKINNIVRKHNGYIEIEKSKYSSNYIYFFKNIRDAQNVADRINAIILSKLLINQNK